MPNILYLFSNTVPFLGGIASNHLAKTISPEEYYYDHFMDGVTWSLICSTIVLLGSAEIVDRFHTQYNRLPIIFIAATALASIGYGYNLYCLGHNASNEVAEADLKRILGQFKAESLEQTTIISDSSSTYNLD